MDKDVSRKATRKRNIQGSSKSNQEREEERTQESNSREMEGGKKRSWAWAFKEFIKGWRMTTSYNKKTNFKKIMFWRDW